MSQVQTPPDLQADWPTEAVTSPPEKRSPFAFLREFPALIAIAFGVAILLKTFLVQAFFIPSESMLPTLEIGDRVIVNKLAYRFRDPARGEVVVFVAERFETDRSLLGKVRDFFIEGLGVSPPSDERDFIKRVIGLPGDTIQVTNKGVFITPSGGERFRLDEPYIFDEDSQGPPQRKFVVPEDHFFVMGDNRANSSDSRSSLGPIAREDIIGKAFVLIWPPSRSGLLDVPAYGPPDQRAAVAAGVGGLPVAALALGGGIRMRRRARLRLRASDTLLG